MVEGHLSEGFNRWRKGSELFIPKTSGTIIPNDRIGGASATNNIVVNVDASF